MPAGFDTRETWPYECLRCLHVWEEDFVVRHLADAYGNETKVWLSSGVPVPPPWAGACCPGCGAYYVTSFPSGYLARHPELLSAAEPEDEPYTEPYIRPNSRPDRAPVKRRHLSGRLLIAFGVPLAVFVGWEFYASFVAHAHTGP
ncbi:hypothetical protein ITP53_32800 [Nonomuraea sp. K274]|uniref:Uncharacterized protein n=1 Tax=Nonomuraea cypriaca TaxID=1187855 RepID=A0A931AHI7_9ACTN|nr:hypothetical protein [Nonomuraea cypriaca]MBF8190409.1 hypothetical protein [Nonomuraea cypriaca]